MNLKTTFLILFLIGSLFCAGCTGNETSNTETSAGITEDGEPVIYELRTYTTHEGKLDDLHKRFENHTMALFEKHGMTNIIYWSPETPELRDNTLIYLLSHDSRDAAEESWQNFSNDPEWQQVYEASRADGPIVQRVESVFMNKTPYSP